MNRQEMYAYLQAFDWSSKKETRLSSVYFLVTHDDITEPIYFFEYEGSYFESDCQLMSCDMTDEELQSYVEFQYDDDSYHEALEYERMLCRNGKHYEIISSQCMPFLQTIDAIIPLSETECLDYLLKSKE